MAAGFSRHGMPTPASNPDLWPFDLETRVRVASKVGNLPSKSEHARPLGSRSICYVRDGQRDRRTDKINAYCPFPRVGARGHNNVIHTERETTGNPTNWQQQQQQRGFHDNLSLLGGCRHHNLCRMWLQRKRYIIDVLYTYSCVGITHLMEVFPPGNLPPPCWIGLVLGFKKSPA